MDKPLRVLHLEDDPDFSALVSAMLEQEGLTCEVISVSDYAGFAAALDRQSFDIILADYLLPTYNGIQALHVARETHPETPFLLVSGTIGEQAAIQTLKAGATDYVLKNGLERLIPAVRRAVMEARERAQRRRAETELVRREKYFRTLTENSLDVLSILSQEGIFQYNSPSVGTVLGYQAQELLGRKAFDLVHADDLQATLGAFETALRDPASRVTHQFRFRHRDGSWRYLETVGRNRLDDPDISGVVLNSRDISDRKRAEAEVVESERQYRLIFEGNPIPMWISDLGTGAFLEVNVAATQHYGYSRAEFLSMQTFQIRPAEEADRLAKYVAEAVKKESHGGIGHAGLWRHRKKDGTAMDVEITWSMMPFKGREALLTMAHDVTERKQAAEALRKSEAGLAAAQRVAHLGSWEMDLSDLETIHRNELRWSDEAYRIFGLEPRQTPVTSEIFFEFVHPEDRDRVAEACEQAIRSGNSYEAEHRIVLRNGEERIVRERAELALDAEGRPIQMLGTVMDVTERKRLEEQLRQSQKMEAIGQLAGGVAHDFNNILTVMHGHASLLLANEKVPEAGRRSAQQIAQAVERAAGLTRQLLTFSRRQVMQPRRLDLNEIVSDMTMMLGRILGEDITLQLNYSPTPACVLADASMIEQVLLNLSVNARDAMPKGGQLAVRISRTTVTEQDLAQRPERRAGDFICLSVVDNGSGIPPENLRRIFEPFFTTKEVGKGTGLGLATVYGIVKQHQGWIEVESELGHGSAFRVFLPASDATENATEPKIPDAPVRGGTETILVVEDEAPVRELVCHVLENLGYRIVCAESGVKALELWKQTPQKMDLLLTDLVMPDRINGRELAERLREDEPSLKVIFTSGYSAEVVGRDFVWQRGHFYLQKPFEPRKLAAMVRNCLDARAPGKGP